MGPVLYIFGGLPGTGKSTLSSALARRLPAAYIRIDSIEQELRNSGQSDIGETGYVAAYRISLDNLRLGNTVVADSVNPIGLTRAAWIGVAKKAAVPYVEIEIVCSDASEHRKRVESRETDIAGLTLPTWDQVIARHYEAWTGEHLVIDTAGQTIDESKSCLFAALQINV